jgi:hypothetical protein
MSVDDDAYDPGPSEGDVAEYVPAFFARDQEEAEEYCELLNDHDIPARCGVDVDPQEEADSEHRVAGRRGITHGVPVLVPETLLDEASEIIADREDFTDFDDDEEDEEDDEDEDDEYGLEDLPEEDKALLEEEEEQDDEEEEEEEEDEDPLFDEADDLDDLEDEDDGAY